MAVLATPQRSTRVDRADVLFIIECNRRGRTLFEKHNNNIINRGLCDDFWSKNNDGLVLMLLVFGKAMPLMPFPFLKKTCNCSEDLCDFVSDVFPMMAAEYGAGESHFPTLSKKFLEIQRPRPHTSKLLKTQRKNWRKHWKRRECNADGGATLFSGLSPIFLWLEQSDTFI